MRNDKIISCRSLCMSFGGIRALQKINIDFPQDGIVAVIGPNGAGKTTLFNVITGLNKPDSGRCVVGQFDITAWQPYKIARLGIARTFQQLRLIKQLSVMDNVLLHRPNQKGERFIYSILPFLWHEQEEDNKAHAKQLLEYVGLEKSLANINAGQLSYGQQKLLSIACCLATDANILLLDEPLSGVHPEIRLQILELMGDLKEEGKLLIFIEHDIESVKQIADQIFLMDEGKVVLVGTPEEVLDHPDTIDAYLG